MSKITEHSGREGSFHSRLDKELAKLGIQYDDVFSLIVSDLAYAERVCRQISLSTMGVEDRTWRDDSNGQDYLLCRPRIKPVYADVADWARKNDLHLVPHQVPDWSILTKKFFQLRFIDLLSCWGRDGFQAYSEKSGKEYLQCSHTFSFQDTFLVYADPDKRPRLADMTPEDWKGRRLLVALDSIRDPHSLEHEVRRMGYTIASDYGQYGSKMEPPFPTDRMFIATDLHTGGLEHSSQLSTWSAEGTARQALDDGSRIEIGSLILANKLA